MFGFEEDTEDLSLSFAPQRVQLCDLFGLHAQAFPPEQRLNRSQITALLKAIERLWSAYQISWDMPYGLSARRRYVVMAEKMQFATIDYAVGKSTEIDFCTVRKQCPFGEGGVCTCREVERSVERDLLAWENRDITTSEQEPYSSPLEEMRRWINDGKDVPPWFLDEKDERWNAFKDNKEQLEWLYFFRPEGRKEQDQYPYELDDDTDFEDFDWEESNEERPRFDDDLDLPF